MICDIAPDLLLSTPANDTWLSGSLRGQLTLLGPLAATLDVSEVLLHAFADRSTLSLQAVAGANLPEGFPTALTSAPRDQMLWVAHALRLLSPPTRRQRLAVALDPHAGWDTAVIGDLLSALADWVVGNHVPATDELPAPTPAASSR